MCWKAFFVKAHFFPAANNESVCTLSSRQHDCISLFVICVVSNLNNFKLVTCNWTPMSFMHQYYCEHLDGFFLAVFLFVQLINQTIYFFTQKKILSLHNSGVIVHIISNQPPASHPANLKLHCTCPITPWIVLHSVLIPWLIFAFSFSTSCLARAASNGKSYDGIYAFWGEFFCLQLKKKVSKSFAYCISWCYSRGRVTISFWHQKGVLIQEKVID